MLPDDASADVPAATGPGIVVQRKADQAGGVGKDANERMATAGASAGAPLPQPVRNKFEGGLGADLGDVRVHTGGASAAAAQSVSARAFAVGSDVHFGSGEYDPDSKAGQQLLAHEVVHTVQQRGAGGAPVAQHKLEVSAPGDAAEIEADTLAESLVSGSSAAPARMSQPVAQVQRAVIYRKDGQSASAAIDSLFNGPTRLECLSTTGAILARAVKETIGPGPFDKTFGAKGKHNQDLVVGPNSAAYHASRMHSLMNPVAPASAADLKPGDWVYFWNCAQYHAKHPGGAWGGENAVYKGAGLFSGFGAFSGGSADMTEEQMNRELHKQYNDGPAAIDQLTFSQWHSAKNERGGTTGLDLTVTQRLDKTKVGDLMP